jgi:hypothetical protein
MGYEIHVHAMNAHGAFRTNKVLCVCVHVSTECTNGKKKSTCERRRYLPALSSQGSLDPLISCLLRGLEGVVDL